MKYRIKKETLRNGEERFYPQECYFIFWQTIHDGFGRPSYGYKWAAEGCLEHYIENKRKKEVIKTEIINT